MSESPDSTASAGNAPEQTPSHHRRGRGQGQPGNSGNRRSHEWQNPGYWLDQQEREELFRRDPSFAARGWRLTGGTANLGQSSVYHGEGHAQLPGRRADGEVRRFNLGQAAEALAWAPAVSESPRLPTTHVAPSSLPSRSRAEDVLALMHGARAPRTPEEALFKIKEALADLDPEERGLLVAYLAALAPTTADDPEDTDDDD